MEKEGELERKETTSQDTYSGLKSKGNAKVEGVFKYEEVVDSLEPKYGLDSNILTYLIYAPHVYRKQYKGILGLKGVFFVHELSIKEAKKVLKKYYNYKEKEAKNAIKNFLKKHNIQIVPENKNARKLAFARLYLCIRDKIELHSPDNIIISDFKEFGINKVFSEDGIFIKAALHLGLKAARFLFKLDPDIMSRFGNLKHFKMIDRETTYKNNP